MTDKKLQRRLLDVCYKHKLHHLESYFSALGIIDDIYGKMDAEDIFILSSGHCVTALYVVLEKYFGIDAEELLEKHGHHPHRDELNKLHCSTGSLGQGITVAVGRAIANPNRDVYCLISDGECAEGSVWEALRYAYDAKVDNLKIYLNANGWSSYDAVDVDVLERRIKAFHPDVTYVRTTVDQFGLSGLDAHYTNFTEEQYKEAVAGL